MKPLALAVALALAACDAPTGVEGDADRLMRTSALLYSLVTRGDRVEVDIPFTFDNRTGGEVYLTSCDGTAPPFLERKEGRQWRTAWTGPDYGCSYSGPVRVPPGAIRTDTLRVFAFPFGGRREPQFSDLNVAGTYRLRWNRALSSYDYTKVPPGKPIELELRVSNEFHLEGEYLAAGDPNAPVLTYLELTASKSPIAVGDSTKMTATGLDQFHKPIAVTDSIIWWTTAAPAGFGVIAGRVDVFPWGTVVGVRAGGVLIHGRAGNATGWTPVEVVPR
jgi:hypothetical protein